MSISDELMWRYFELLSFRPLEDIASLQQEVVDGKNPRDVKYELAIEITTRFHNQSLAKLAKEEFISRFQQGAMPEHMRDISISSKNGELGILNLLKEAGLVTSNSEAARMIEAGAVKLDGERVLERGLHLKKGTTHVYQVGKRKFARVTLK